MKKLLTISLLFICVNSLSAQNDVQQLPLIHPKNPEIVFEKLVASDNSGFYALFNNKKLKSYCIEKFDLQGKSLYSTNFKGEPAFEQIGEKSLYIFSSEFDKDDGKKGKLYLTEINAETGAKVDDKVISQQEIIKKHDYEHFFSLSPDKTKLLVVSRFFCLSEELPEKAVFRFFEVKGMKQIWGKEIDNKLGDNFIKTSKYIVNNEGDVFLHFYYAKEVILVKHISLGGYVADGGSSIATVNSKEKKLNEIKFEIPAGVEVFSFSTVFSNDGKLLFYGAIRDAVGNKNKKEGIESKGGLITLVIDVKTRKSLNIVINRYDADLDKKLSSKENGSGDVYFQVNEILELDGFYYLVCNESYKLTVNYTNSTNSSSWKHSGAILLAKINPSTGISEWMKYIPKSASAKPTAIKDGYALNYHVFIANDKLHFIYLDHPLNFEKNKIEDGFPDNVSTIQGIFKSNVLLVSFDQNGKVKRKIIFDNQENCVLPQMDNVVINNKSLVLRMENFDKKERRFGLITP